jgi:hypothetical protein
MHLQIEKSWQATFTSVSFSLVCALSFLFALNGLRSQLHDSSCWHKVLEFDGYVLS